MNVLNSFRINYAVYSIKKESKQAKKDQQVRAVRILFHDINDFIINVDISINRNRNLFYRMNIDEKAFYDYGTLTVAINFRVDDDYFIINHNYNFILKIV